METLKTINLEFGRPTVDVAMKKFDNELKNAKYNNVGCFLVIHGYGSHGKGGLIRDALRESLDLLKKNNLIKTYVYGEDFKILNKDANKLRHKYKPMIVMYAHNNGIYVSAIKGPIINPATNNGGTN